MKKTASGKRRVRNIAMIVFLCVIVLWGIISFLSLQIDYFKKQRELSDLENQIIQQTISNEELETLLKDENYEEYVIRLAREKLGYVFPNEQIFVDISGN